MKKLENNNYYCLGCDVIVQNSNFCNTCWLNNQNNLIHATCLVCDKQIWTNSLSEIVEENKSLYYGNCFACNIYYTFEFTKFNPHWTIIDPIKLLKLKVFI